MDEDTKQKMIDEIVNPTVDRAMTSAENSPLLKRMYPYEVLALVAGMQLAGRTVALGRARGIKRRRAFATLTTEEQEHLIGYVTTAKKAHAEYKQIAREVRRARFIFMQDIVKETLAAIREAQQAGYGVEDIQEVGIVDPRELSELNPKTNTTRNTTPLGKPKKTFH